MPIVQQLNFDTELFGYKVARCLLDKACNVIPAEIRDYKAKLTYLMCNERLHLGLDCVDEKTFLACQLVSDQRVKTEAILLQKSDSETYTQLLHLAYQSGIHSRFKTDTQFQNQEFEKLYKLWLDKSLTGEAADALYVVKEDKKIAGFMTIKQQEEAADIGLIAVHENYRGANLGGELIQAGINWALDQKINCLTVTTQKQNEQAMHFYLKHKFEVIRTQYIYHIWRA